MAKMKLIPSVKTLTEKGLPAVGGALGGKMVKNLAKNIIKSTDPKKQAMIDKFMPGVPFLAGAMLSEQKGWMGFAGIGMMASSGADLAGKFVPSLAGLEDVDLSGIFDDDVSDSLNDNDADDDMNGPLDGPLDGAGADEDYSQEY